MHESCYICFGAGEQSYKALVYVSQKELRFSNPVHKYLKNM